MNTQKSAKKCDKFTNIRSKFRWNAQKLGNCLFHLSIFHITVNICVVFFLFQIFTLVKHVNFSMTSKSTNFFKNSLLFVVCKPHGIFHLKPLNAILFWSTFTRKIGSYSAHKRCTKIQQSEIKQTEESNLIHYAEDKSKKIENFMLNVECWFHLFFFKSRSSSLLFFLIFMTQKCE